MPIITLTTDFGLKDPSVAAVKGAIYSELGINAKIVDVSHHITPFNIVEAAYIIKNAYKTFPEKSIHILGVDSEHSPINRHIAVQLDGHFFICANNGIISLIANEINPTKCVEINIHDKITSNFPVLDVFVQTAAHIARGGDLDVIGKEINEIKPIKAVEPIVNDDQILGNVLYIDNYGNVISNISKKLFKTVGKGRKFTIQTRGFKFKKILNSYSHIIDFKKEKEKEIENFNQYDGEKLAIFNTSNYLEIAIYRSNSNSVGSAASLFGLNLRDLIKVTFEN